ncbi:MAG: glycosyltransferase family 2 protein [Thermodesulfovibrionales bacterium]|nr:glycosyltransferase family 2 protein [Thermodesulfovibrionales bacterium]
MHNPFFSVIIPTHNRANLLSQAIQSVLNQTYNNFELIIIDDHSTDNTQEIIKAFSDSRIKSIVNDHKKGAAGARNAGIFKAMGQWVAFLDDDDIWFPQKLELQYDMIHNVGKIVGLIYTGYAVYDFDKMKEVQIITPEKEGWIQKDLLYTNCIGPPCSVIIRKSLLEQIKGFDDDFPAYQDCDLYVRIAGLAQIAYIKDTLLYVRTSGNDRISVNPQKKLDGFLLFQKKYNALIKNNPVLKHRISSVILYYAIRLKNWPVVFKFLPWTIAGVMFNLRNLLKILWGIYLVIIKSKKADL